MTTAELIAGTRDLQERIGLRDEPMAFFYTDRLPEGYQVASGQRVCVVAALARVRQGQTVFCDANHFGCGGAGYFLGFTPPLPTVDEFVSTGIPGRMEGEHYKKSPELVRRYREGSQVKPAPAPYAVFKPVSQLAEEERPAIIFSLANPDELSGLVFLANYARAEDAVVCPFGSGCHSLVTRVLLESEQPEPRAVLGMFDPSARPCVPADRLSFAAPLALWEEMVANAAESFLSTPTWAKVRQRIREEK